MKDKLRELAAEWLRKGEFSKNSGAPRCGGQMIEDATELLAILDAEGDGGAVGEDVVDRVAKAIADAAGHGMREKCEHMVHAAISAYRLATWPETHPARSGVVSDEDVRDAERYRWLRKYDNADLLAEDVIDDAINTSSQGERHER